MKKLLSIVLALALVLGMLPAFADTTSTETPGEVLKRYGVIVGGQNGNLNEDGKLSRAELTVIIARMHGKVEEAQNFAAEHPFTDVPADHWAKGFISFAKAQGLMSGTSENTFNPDGNVDNNMLASVLIRALGYDTPADYATSAEQLNKLTNISIPSGDIKRADLFNALVPALKDNLMKDGKSLGKDVLKIQAIINDIPAHAALEISEVSAHNLKQIHVKFNQNVNKDSLAEAFELKGFKITPVLNETGDTVVLELDKKLTNQKDYKLVIKDVVSTTEQKLDKVEKTFSAFDGTLPEVKNVQFTGPRHVTITFSEPIDKTNANNGKVEIKKGNSTLAVNNTAFGVDGNVVTAETFGTFVQDAEYEIKISNFKDYAGYENVVRKDNLTYSKDTESPFAEAISYDSTQVVVKFSKPVKGIDRKNFAHSFTGWSAIGVTDMDEQKLVSSKTYTQVIVKFYEKGNASSHALPAGDVKFMVFPKTATTKIEDLWGNLLADHETTLKVAIDDQKPEIVASAVEDSTTISLTFNKAVGLEKKHVKASDKDGKNVLIKKVVVDDKDSKVWYVEFINSQEGEEVTLAVTGAEDKTPNENKMVAFNQKFNFGDTTKVEFDKVVFKGYTLDTDGKTVKTPAELYIFYKENVDNAATVAANYSIVDGNNLIKLTQDGDFFENPKVVKFELTKAQADKITANTTKLYVVNVKDLAGNGLFQNLTDTVKEFGKATVPAILVNKLGTQVILEAADQYRVVFDNPISSYDPSKFIVCAHNATDSKNSVKSHELVDGNSVRIYLNEKISGWNDNTDVDRFLLKAGAVTNNFGTDNKAVTTPIAFVNNIKPTFAPKVLKNDEWKNNPDLSYVPGTRTIKIPFTMKLDDSGVDAKIIAANDFKVYADGELIAPDKITFTLQNATAQGTNIASSVVQLIIADGVIGEDVQTIAVQTTDSLKYVVSEANKKITIDAVSKTFENLNHVAPKVVKVEPSKGDTNTVITLTFNEELYTAADGTTKLGDTPNIFKAWNPNKVNSGGTKGDDVAIVSQAYTVAKINGVDTPQVKITIANVNIASGIQVYADADLFDKDSNKLEKGAKGTAEENPVMAKTVLGTAVVHGTSITNINNENHKVEIKIGEDVVATVLGTTISGLAKSSEDELINAFADIAEVKAKFTVTEHETSNKMAFVQKDEPTADGQKITFVVTGDHKSEIEDLLGIKGSHTETQSKKRVPSTKAKGSLVELDGTVWK